MNWKNYFEEFKTGDRILFVKASALCPYSHSHNCCKNSIGQNGTILNIENKKGDARIYKVQMDGTNTHCWFEKECLERAYDGS